MPSIVGNHAAIRIGGIVDDSKDGLVLIITTEANLFIKKLTAPNEGLGEGFEERGSEPEKSRNGAHRRASPRCDD